jgi:hypothetical protein
MLPNPVLRVCLSESAARLLIKVLEILDMQKQFRYV